MGLILLIFLIAIIFLFVALINANAEYKNLKAEWEKMNSDMDVLTCNYSKAKKEISDLQDRNDDLSIRCNNEIQMLTEKYEKKLKDTKDKLKAAQANVDALIVKEAGYLTSLEEAAMREASLLNTIEENTKIMERNVKKIARATTKKKKEEKAEQLEIALEEVNEIKGFEFTVDDVEIAPGEGETKCEKKRRRKKGENN